MGVKRILVHVDGTERAQRALAAALQLAAAQDAHLIGCGVLADPYIPTYVGAQIPGDVVEVLIQEQHRQVAEAKRLFEKAVSAAGWVDRAEFVQGRGDVARALAREGRGCDLIIVGQAEPDEEPVEIEDLPDNTVLESGRPVLIVPYISQTRPVGRTVLLCWTNTREAARAMTDALPLLNASSSVIVLTAGEEGRGDEIVGDDAARFLAAHGIAAEIRKVPGGGLDVGSVILNEAADTGADLIVMGAYGHSRLRETILGGATRTVLRNMTVPVLMSH